MKLLPKDGQPRVHISMRAKLGACMLILIAGCATDSEPKPGWTTLHQMKLEAQTQRVQTCIANAQALYRGMVTYMGPIVSACHDKARAYNRIGIRFIASPRSVPPI